MAVFKCKMCGGDLEVIPGQSVAECIYCGTQQTLPKLEDDRRINMYDRANHFRRNNDYDKAMGLYEQILNEDKTDAEAYWSLVLCRYGIEYVEDPVSHKRVPTVNRAQYTSIFMDEDYKSAIQYADATQKAIYEEEAKYIDGIQKGILEISRSEKPFDVFICYKESDENGRRTRDSVLANDLYHQLVQEGFKVFYARITLEDKLGSAYEPYIFAALNSAKVMVALGTKPAYFNAVWVKNEWSRYLALIKKGEKKMLIPAYRDMDPYDLPEEFSHLQAQDMSKLGFMQDLIRGIKKILETAQPKRTETTPIVQQTVIQGANQNALIERGNIALEDAEWQKADGFFEEALNQDARCAEAYLGKWLASKRQVNLESLAETFIDKYDVSKKEKRQACKVDSERIAAAVEKYIIPEYLGRSDIEKEYYTDLTYESEVASREEQKQKFLTELNAEKTYVRALQYASGKTADILSAFRNSILKFLEEKIQIAEEQDQRDRDDKIQFYLNFLVQAEKNVTKLFEDVKNNRDIDYHRVTADITKAQTIHEYEICLTFLNKLHPYKDSEELINNCRKQISRIEEETRIELEKQELEKQKQAERQAKKRKITIGILTGISFLAVITFFVVTKIIIPNNNYNASVKLMEDGMYEEAIVSFEALEGYKDSKDQINACKGLINADLNSKALEEIASGNYESAIATFESMVTYENSSEQRNEYERVFDENLYDLAIEMINSEKYIDAHYILSYLGSFNDSNKKIEEITFDYQLELMANASVGDHVFFGHYEQDGNTNNGPEEIEWDVLDIQDGNILLMTDKCISARPFHTVNADVSWKNCTLRKWLINDFYNGSFSDDEKKHIMETELEDVAVTDSVFALSLKEMEDLTKKGVNRQCTYTNVSAREMSEFSEKHERSYRADVDDHAAWILRTRSEKTYSNYVYMVNSDGSYGDAGGCVDGYNGIGLNVGVRPALWVRISNEIE